MQDNMQNNMSNPTGLKELPIGVQTFEDLIEGGYVYVDKTRHLYELISPAKGVYFLSRPRRFGKSLLISTLEALFLGKRHLFKGLWIDQTDYAWPVHPVIRVDMTQVLKRNQDFNEALLEEVQGLCRQFNIDPTFTKTASGLFRYLIEQLGQKSKVVILIDEYDKPILDGLTRPEKANENREILKEFYSVIKAQDANVRFVLLTGVTKFAKVSVFSGLNNLQDLTMTRQAAALCGYTQEELEYYFEKRIEVLASFQETTVPETLQKIKEWYNGYQFSEAEIRVYNPFSTLLLFQHRAFKPHWFETGTPTFLIELLTQQEYPLDDLDGQEVVEDSFSTFEVETLEVLPLLVQTGYLTIQHYDPETMLYTLGYPNFEVKAGFLSRLTDRYSHAGQGKGYAYGIKLAQAFKREDLDEVMRILNLFFANIPYDIQIKKEKYYQSIFYLIFTILGFNVYAEVRTNRGRIDAVVETENRVYIFEFKLDDTAEAALEQIKTQEYYKRYQGSQKTVTLLGVSFDTKQREMTEWVVE